MISREELFSMLEMEDPKDFEYFEQFAELVETDEEVEFGDFYAVLSAVSMESLSELNENYFEEAENALPQDHDDFLEVLQNYHQSLKLLANDSDNEEFRREYADGLFKFRTMYTRPDGASVDGKPCSVLEAIAESRLAKLDNIQHDYNFDNSLDCLPDYVSMRLGGYEDEYDSYDPVQND